LHEFCEIHGPETDETPVTCHMTQKPEILGAPEILGSTDFPWCLLCHYRAETRDSRGHYAVITTLKTLRYTEPDVITTGVNNMHDLTASALSTLCEVWDSIRIETENNAEPVYQARLWHMVTHMCSAYAMQHSAVGGRTDAEMFEWLMRIAEHRQLMALHPKPSERPVKLALVQSLDSVRH
jgi:hypothetical protein